MEDKQGSTEVVESKKPSFSQANIIFFVILIINIVLLTSLLKILFMPDESGLLRLLTTLYILLIMSINTIVFLYYFIKLNKKKLSFLILGIQLLFVIYIYLIS